MEGPPVPEAEAKGWVFEPIVITVDRSRLRSRTRAAPVARSFPEGLEGPRPSATALPSGDGRLVHTGLRGTAGAIERAAVVEGVRELAAPERTRDVGEVAGAARPFLPVGSMLGQREQLQACLAGGGARFEPVTRTKLSLTWLVLPDGSTTDIVIAKNKDIDAEGIACILGAVSAWRFAPAPGRTTPGALVLVLS